MTSLVDILGSYVAVDDAGSDGGIVEVDGACEDGACAFGAREVPAPATPEGASDMHISGGAAGDNCTSSTPTRGSGPTSDGGVINVDDVSEVGGLAFGARGVPASETAGAIVIGMTTSAGGGGAAATPGNAGDPTRNVGAESDICAVMAAGTYSYSAEALRAELKSIPMEGKNLEDVETAVKQTCATHGVKIARDSSRREKGEGGRLVMIAWKCVHGMRNRQTDRQGQRRRSTAGLERVRRKASSQRTGCAFKITARWPLLCPVNKHPRLTTMYLEHQHAVDKEAMEIKHQMKAPLSSPMKAAAVKLTDAGLAPAVQAKVLKALHNRRVNTRAVQNAASQHSDGENIQSTPVRMEENGPTVQDRRKLYVDLLQQSTAMIAQGVETVDAETLRQIFETCRTQINQAARIGLGTGVVVGNPDTVHLPAGRRLGNKRHKSSVETRYSTGTRTASQSYN